MVMKERKVEEVKMLSEVEDPLLSLDNCSWHELISILQKPEVAVISRQSPNGRSRTLSGKLRASLTPSTNLKTSRLEILSGLGSRRTQLPRNLRQILLS